MPVDNAFAWDQFATAYQARANLPTDIATYGPGVGTEADFRLLGDLRGKRVLDLGCGGAQSSIAFAKAGATAIGVDASAQQLAHARRLCEAEGVRVDLHHEDLADLPFVRANSVDLVFSAWAFGFIEDLSRVFRQVQRVLRPGSPLVFSLPHPAWHLIDEAAADPLAVRRSYYDRKPIDWFWDGTEFTSYQHTLEDLFMGLNRAGLRLDNVLEPMPRPDAATWTSLDAARVVPRALVLRARKD